MNRDLKLMAIRYLDGGLTAPQILEFEKRLKAEEGVDDFVRLARREAMLTELLRFPGTDRQVAALTETRRPRSLRLVVRSLALAASIAIIAGASVIISRTAGKSAEELAFNRADHTPVIAKKIGVLSVEGHRVATGPESYCLLTYPDRTRVALDENSAAAFPPAPSPDEKRIVNQAGRLYVEATPQHKPILVDAGPMSVRILGTRLLLGSGDDTFAEVLEGQIQVSRGTASALLHAGQRIRPVQAFEKPWLALQTHAWPSADLNWLTRIGLNTPSAPPLPERGLPRTPELLRSPLLIGDGTWDIARNETDLAAFQREPTGQATLLMGEPDCRRGLFAFSFRALNPAKTPSINPVFFGRQSPPQTLSLESWTTDFHRQGYTNWFDVKVLFEATAQGELFIPRVEINPRENPDTFKFKQGLRVGLPRESSGRVGVGLRTLDTAAEFAGIGLQCFEPDADRVADGLLTLHRGTDGSGPTLPDLAGRYDGMDLNAKQAGNIRRKPESIRGRDLSLRDTRDLLRTAARKNRGFTIELWFKYTGERKQPDSNPYAILALSRPQGMFNMNSQYAFGVNAGELCHSVLVFERAPDGPVATYYFSGLPGNRTSARDLDRVVETAAKHMDITVFPSRTVKGSTPVPPETELYLMAIYDRPLSPEETLQNYFAGPQPDRSPRTAEGLIAEFYGATGLGATVLQARLRDTGMRIQPARPEIAAGKRETGYDLIVQDPNRKIRDAWNKQDGLTFEIWFRYAGPEMNKTNLHTMLSYRSPLGKFHQNSSDGFTVAAGQPTQLVCVLNRRKGDGTAEFYSNGRFISDIQWPWLNRFMNDTSFEIVAFPSEPDKTMRVVPPATDLLYFGMYGRALAPKEIQRNFLSNAPVPPRPEASFPTRP